MSVAGGVLAAVFAALGVRSVAWWLRRPFETADVRDNLLFAAYLTGRAGLWFAMSGLFVLLGTDTGTRYASGDTSARAFVHFASGYRWFALVFPVLGSTQLVAGYFLGRRASR